MALTQDYLKTLLRYDPSTGHFFWIKSRRKGMPDGHRAGYVNNDGYRMIEIDGKAQGEHRLAVLYMLGVLPLEVDHDNRVRNDNRWVNLIPTTHSGNMQNKSPGKNNKSGVVGVFRQNGKWGVKIRRLYLGSYDTIEEAATVRLAAEKALFTSRENVP